MSSIEIKQNGVTIRSYNFSYEYETIANNARSKLTSVQECTTRNSVQQCLPSTTFGWVDRPNFDFGDHTSPGHCADDAGGDVGCDGVENYSSFKYPDLNGDGYADLCYQRDDGLRCHLNISWSQSASSEFSQNTYKFFKFV